MLTISGLREEYNSLKPTLISREPAVTFLELSGLISDHEYMIKKAAPTIPSTQAFTATTNREPNSLQIPPDTLQSLQQLLTQLGLTVQSIPQQSQAFNTTRNTPNNTSYHLRGRGRHINHSHNNRQLPPTNPRFPWASNQNMVYGSCNRCGIGHIPSQCPNRDPATTRSNSLHKPILLIIAHKHLLHGCRTLVQVAMWRPISMALMNLNRTMVRTL
ncbi:putative transcription factor interactor and regulator CCHC(Zn) family [Helianthus anomalus]